MIYQWGNIPMVLQDRRMEHYFHNCRGGAPEAPLIEWATTLVNWDTQRLPRFVDIGAHVGTWTAQFAARGALVDAFEPNPEIFRCLQASIGLNGWKVATHNIAKTTQRPYRPRIPTAVAGVSSVASRTLRCPRRSL